MEQTTQLIQLILNSLLMVLICVIVLSGLMTRHRAVVDRLHQLQQEYLGLLEQALSHLTRQQRLSHTKAQIHVLRRRYRLTRASILAAVYGLLCCLSSAFALACRTLISWNSLITLALTLFAVGLGILLLSIGIALLDLYTDSRSLWGDWAWLLQGQQGQQAESASVKPATEKSRGRSQPTKRAFRKAVL